jgi:hypothetical protein
MKKSREGNSTAKRLNPSHKDKYNFSWNRREMATFLLILKFVYKRRKEVRHRQKQTD